MTGSVGTVGKCVTKDGKVVLIEREWYRQGLVFKNWEAFDREPSAPCYVPELTDTVYSRADFVRICDGQEVLAEALFAEVDWQHPESLLEEWVVNGDWSYCDKCSRLFDALHNADKCPHCGNQMEDRSW